MSYCTNRDLKDIFPSIDEFDTKTPIYGWVQVFSSGGNYLYEAYDAGLVTVLYKNGHNLTPHMVTESYTDSTANTDEAVEISESQIDVTDSAVFALGDILRIDTEKMLITSIATNKLTVKRAILGTTSATHTTATDIYIGATWVEDGQWLYNSDDDVVLYYSTDAINPNDLLMESGDDWVDIRTRFISNASKYLDSRLDGKLPRSQFKDQDGNYDYIIIRTSALLACSFLIRASDPASEIADALFDEADKNILSLNSGATKLSWQTTGDAPMGIIREKSVSGNIRIVDTMGAYSGRYDKIGIKISTAGVMGTAKYSYWVGDSDNIGAERMNNSETATLTDNINGNYQPIGNGLYIRFAGDTGDTATLNDSWEIEVHSKTEIVDNAMPSSLRRTRR